MPKEVMNKLDFSGRVKVVSNNEDIIFHRIQMKSGEERTQLIFTGLFEVKLWMPRRSELLKGTCKVWDLTEQAASQIKKDISLIGQGTVIDELFVCDDGAKRRRPTLYLSNLGLDLRHQN